MMDSRKRSSGSSIEAEDKASKRQRIINSTPDKLDSCIALQDWSPKQVYDILVESKIPKEEAELLKDHEISGKHLLKLSREDLKEIGVMKFGIQSDILAVGESCYIGMEKVFNDPIHGHIELHPLMVKIIDTPQFQRLRGIKQLGGGYYVFMGASHHRFEHSIGVGYLAGELVETLHKKQPELGISCRDILCVKIAGLCHDLGHGPFSHMFETRFIHKVKPGTDWKHENASVMMFNHLLKVNNLHGSFEQYGLDSKDILFIEEQIAGPSCSELNSQQCSSWPYSGRGEEKSFLYEIVANKRNGIDVDKWDYFARDCHCLGIPNNFDMQRYMKFARVIHVNSRRQICTRDKEVGNLYEMFHTRISLHRRAYQHKTANIIEYMITEALIKANDHLLLPGKEGPMKMSEAISDPYAYTRLTDCVVQQILMSSDPNLQESQDLLLKIERREIYKCVGQAQRKAGDIIKNGSSTGILADEIISSLCDTDLKGLPALTVEDLVVEVVSYDYGMNDEDPIEHMRFYMKDNPTKAVRLRRDQVSQMLPKTFKEQNIRVYSKRLDCNGVLAAKKYFMAWCQKYAHITSKGDEHCKASDTEDENNDTSYTIYATPIKDGCTDEVNKDPMVKKETVKKLF